MARRVYSDWTDGWVYCQNCGARWNTAMVEHPPLKHCEFCDIANEFFENDVILGQIMDGSVHFFVDKRNPQIPLCTAPDCDEIPEALESDFGFCHTHFVILEEGL